MYKCIYEVATWQHPLVSEVPLQRLKVSFVVVAKLLYWNRMIRVKSSSD